jgi:hypothetical protein
LQILLLISIYLSCGCVDNSHYLCLIKAAESRHDRVVGQRSLATNHLNVTGWHVVSLGWSSHNILYIIVD